MKLPDRDGAFIQHVGKDTPAARAGLHTDDIVRAIDAQPMKTGEDVRRYVARKKAGDVLRFEVLRGRMAPTKKPRAIYRKEIKVWDVASGQWLRSFPFPRETMVEAAFSPDGKALVIHSAPRRNDTYGRGELRLLDIRTGALLWTSAQPAEAALALVFSPDGRLLAGLCADRRTDRKTIRYTLRVWDARSGKSRHAFALPPGERAWTPIAFSPDGSRLVAMVGWDSGPDRDRGAVRTWDTMTGKVLRTRILPENVIQVLAVSPDLRLLAASCHGASVAGENQAPPLVQLFGVETGQVVSVLTGHRAEVRVASFSPDGRMLAGGSVDTSIRLWDVTTGQLRRTLWGHRWGVWHLGFGRDSKSLISGEQQSMQVKRWNLNATAALDAMTEPRLLLGAGYNWEMTLLAWARDGATLTGWGTERRRHAAPVRHWDVATLEQKSAVPLSVANNALLSNYMPAALSPDGRLLAFVPFFERRSGKDISLRHREVQVWDAQTGKLLRTVTGFENYIHGVGFSPDGSTLATVSGSREAGRMHSEVKLWDTATGQLRRTLRGPDARGEAFFAVTNTIVFSPNGRRLAVRGNLEGVDLWDIGTGTRLKSLPVDAWQGFASGLAFSPDGKLLAGTNGAGLVRVWDVEAAKMLWAARQGRMPGGAGAAFSPDGTLLATVVLTRDRDWSYIGTSTYQVRLQDARTGALVCDVAEGSVGECTPAFAPDGKALAVATGAGAIRLWDISRARQGIVR